MNARAQRKLIARAYDEAAEVVRNACDAIDLPEDLSEAEEEFMREYMRNNIVEELRIFGRRASR